MFIHSYARPLSPSTVPKRLLVEEANDLGISLALYAQSLSVTCDSTQIHVYLLQSYCSFLHNSQEQRFH